MGRCRPADRFDHLFDQAGLHVIAPPDHGNPRGQKWARSHHFDVPPQVSIGIGHGQKLPVGGVGNSPCAQGLPDGPVGGEGQSAVGVLQDDDTSHPQHPGGEDQRSQCVAGDPPAGIADDLGIAGPEPQNGEGIHPGVHAGHQGQSFGRPSRHSGTVEIRSEPTVLVQQVVEHDESMADRDSALVGPSHPNPCQSRC